MKTRRTVLIGLTVGLVVTATACSTNSSGGSASGSTGAAAPSLVTGDITFNDGNLAALRDKVKQALAGKDLSAVHNAVVVNVTAAYWDAARTGVQKAAAELGVKAVFQEPSTQDIGQQLSILNTLISQDTTGFSVSAIQPSSVSSAIDAAAAKKIGMIAIDSPLDMYKSNVPLYLGTPNYEAGQKAGTTMKQLLPDGGDVGVLAGSLTATNATQRIQGFKDALNGSKVKVFQVYNDNGDAGKALQNASAAFQADPGLKGLYGVYSYDGPSAGQAVQSAGKAGKVMVVADDSEPKTLSLLQQGAIQATVLQQPYQQGYLSVYLLTAMKVLGEPATMELVRPYLDKDGYTLSSGTGLVTEKNLADYNKKMAGFGVGDAVTGIAEVAVRLTGIQKIYGPVRVLAIENLSLLRGQVVALAGENGAGKSTLMGVLAGTVRPDTGVVEVAGTRLEPGRPAVAAEAGIAMVSQEFPLVGQLSVAENLMLGRRPQGARRGVVDRRRLYREAQAALDELGLGISAWTRLDSLSVAQRQLVEIAKAWHRRPLVLILDEPTSALGPVEARLVLDRARRHAELGGCVVFVGHRLDEVLDVADRLIVLRNGEVVADYPRAEAGEERLIREMVGAELAADTPIAPVSGDGTVFEATGLTADGLGPVDLTVREGEIVGVAGLMGSGRSRLLHTIFGAQPATGGTLKLTGRAYAPRSPADAIAAGVALVPQDRKQQSLLPLAPIRWNITLARLPRLARHGYLSPARERVVAAGIVRDFRVRCQSPEQPINALSGGNQQRAVFGRSITTEPLLLLLDEPTRGVDVGAKAEIYRMVGQAAATGCAVVVASSELEELMRICHRIVVLIRGRISTVVERGNFSKELIMTHAAGAVSANGTAGDR